MSTKTENLKLTKPAATDIVDISTINENMDIIDENLATRAEMNTVSARIDNLVANTGNSNSEIVDARLGYDGVTDASLGEAVRRQISKSNSEITALRSEYKSADATLRSDYESADASIMHTVSARIDNLVANTGNSNSEIVDARLGYDGVTYTSLGEAVRRQISKSNSEITALRTTTTRIENSMKSLRLYRDDEGYLCEMEE